MIEQAHLPKAARKPFRRYKREQAWLSRQILYPVTAFYTLYSIVMFYAAGRSQHPYIAIAFYVAALPIWTYLEYLAHRFILHGTFRKSKHSWKVYKTLANKFLDPLHWEHHARPWDGEHINGRIMDTLPFSIALVALAGFFPLWSMPVLMAGLLQSYVVEEWVHHSVHFYHFDNPYFRYIKRHHLYHHSPKGGDVGYGLTNGLWDIIFSTRISAEQRRLLYGQGKAEGHLLGQRQAGAGPLSTA